MTLENAADLFACSQDSTMPGWLHFMPVSDTNRPGVIAEIYCEGCEGSSEVIRESDDADIVLDAIGCACADHEECEY